MIFKENCYAISTLYFCVWERALKRWLIGWLVGLGGGGAGQGRVRGSSRLMSIVSMAFCSFP